MSIDLNYSGAAYSVRPGFLERTLGDLCPSIEIQDEEFIMAAEDLVSHERSTPEAQSMYYMH